MSPRISIRLLAAQSDQRLAGLAEEGHERAFEALVQRHRRPLMRYCRRMGVTEGRAEDVLQQAFLQAWMAFARGAEVRDLRAWLYRIVHNVAVNAMRGPAAAHGELTEAAQDRAALAEESELQRAIAVHDALTGVAALPRMQQRAIFLSAVDGQSHDEVASVLGISEGAVRGLIHRARIALRSAAAALTPPQLLEWAAGGSGPAAPTAERLAELSTGPSAAGLGGLLLKGAVVAITAGAVATGATVASSGGQRSQAASLACRRREQSPSRCGSFGRARCRLRCPARRCARTRADALRADPDTASATVSARWRGRDGSGSGKRRLAQTGADGGSQGGQGPGDSGSHGDAPDAGSSSRGSGSSGGESTTAGSGKEGDSSGSGPSSASSGHGGSDDVAIAPATTSSGEQPVVVASDPGQPASTSGSGSGDDATASAPVSGVSDSKGRSGSDG